MTGAELAGWAENQETSREISLQDINPVIRFSQRICYRSMGDLRCAADVHLFYVLEGRGQLRLGQETVPLSNDVLLLIQPGDCYSFEAGSDLQMFVLNFDYDTRRRTLTQLIPFAQSPDRLPVPPYRVTVSDCPALSSFLVLRQAGLVRDSVARIVDIREKRQLYYEERASCQLKEVLIDLARATELLGAQSGQVIVQLLAYIHEHYNETITAEQLSERFNYHAYHLNRLMRKATGTTIHRYLVEYRITMAQKLLAETGASIGSIAKHVGFSDFAYFSSCFSSVTGCTPSAYRNLICGSTALRRSDIHP